MRPHQLVVSLLALCGLASAGGLEPLTRLDALRGLPGATAVVEVPRGQIGQASYTHLVRVRTATGDVEVRVSFGAREGSASVNSPLLWVDRPRATASDREALTRVAGGLVARCSVGVTGGQLRAIQALAGRDWWADLGSQSQQLGSLLLEWSGREGLNVAGREVSGLRVEWPGAAGRCVF